MALRKGYGQIFEIMEFGGIIPECMIFRKKKSIVKKPDKRWYYDKDEF